MVTRVEGVDRQSTDELHIVDAGDLAALAEQVSDLEERVNVCKEMPNLPALYGFECASRILLHSTLQFANKIHSEPQTYQPLLQRFYEACETVENVAQQSLEQDVTPEAADIVSNVQIHAQRQKTIIASLMRGIPEYRRTLVQMLTARSVEIGHTPGLEPALYPQPSFRSRLFRPLLAVAGAFRNTIWPNKDRAGE